MGFKRVFVTVGTTKFNKLILSVTKSDVLKVLKERGCEELILQIGNGDEPNIEQTDINITWYRFKPNLSEDYTRADLVIAHAGGGTCLEVLSANKTLIVVSNEDLMDSHQDELASKFRSLNYLVYTSPQKLAQDISNLDPSSLDPYVPGDPSVFASFIDSMLELNHSVL